MTMSAQHSPLDAAEAALHDDAFDAAALFSGSQLTTVGVMVLDQSERIWYVIQWRRAGWRGFLLSPGVTVDVASGARPGARLTTVIRECLTKGQPARLSHYLNKAIFPLHHPLDSESALAQTVNAQPVALAGDDGRACLIEVLDVSIEADREAKLRGKIGELARANANLEIFSSAASHDLKAPLRAMQVMTSWIEHEIDRLDLEMPEGIIDALTRINRRAGQMTTLLDDLLTYCRIDNQLVDAVTLAPRPVIMEALEILALPPEFRVVVEDDLPEIKGNHAELALMMRNVISNAAKHHDKGGGVITVSGGQSETASWLSVTDDGPGVDPEDFERVFEPFVSRSKQGGSGLGLAMVQRLAQNRGGATSVQSPVENGRGATFTISLPKH